MCFSSFFLVLSPDAAQAAALQAFLFVHPPFIQGWYGNFNFTHSRFIREKIYLSYKKEKFKMFVKNLPPPARVNLPGTFFIFKIFVKNLPPPARVNFPRHLFYFIYGRF